MQTTALGAQLRQRLPVINDFDKWTTCAACGKGCSDIGLHPELEVGFCPACYDRVFEGKPVIDYQTDHEGWELYCRLCGDAGHTVGCDFCEKVNCERCIRRNLGNRTWQATQLSGSQYKCFNCAPQGVDRTRDAQLQSVCRAPTPQEESTMHWPLWLASGMVIEVKSLGIWCQGKVRAVYKDELVCKYTARGEWFQDAFSKDCVRLPGSTRSVAQELKPKRSNPIYQSTATSHNQPFRPVVARKSVDDFVPSPLAPYSSTPPDRKLQVCRKSIVEQNQNYIQQMPKPKQMAAKPKRQTVEVVNDDPYTNQGSLRSNFRQRASDPIPNANSFLGGHRAPPPKVPRKAVQQQQQSNNIEEGDLISPTPYQGMQDLEIDQPPSKRQRTESFGLDDRRNVQPGMAQLSKKSVGNGIDSFGGERERKRSGDSPRSFFSADDDDARTQFSQEPEAEQSSQQQHNINSPQPESFNANESFFSNFDLPSTFRANQEVLMNDISMGKEKIEIPVVVDPRFSSEELQLAKIQMSLIPNPATGQLAKPPLIYQKNAIWGQNAGVCVAARSEDACVGCSGCRCDKPVTKAELQARLKILPKDWMTCVKCSWGAYDASGRLLNADGAIWECNDFCQCNVKTCRNRVVSRGISKKLEVFWAGKDKGFGVRCKQKLLVGDFICEYVGEILTSHEADERGLTNGDAYLFDLTTAQNNDHRDWIEIALQAETGKMNVRNQTREEQQRVPKSARKQTIGGTPPTPEQSQSQGYSQDPGKQDLVIDANWLGNVGRFINHSCAPNLLKSFVWGSIQDPRAPRIAFFAAQDIEPFTELVYDYAYGVVEGKSLACHCGAPNCRGRLY
eukprot:gene1302-278_t